MFTDCLPIVYRLKPEVFVKVPSNLYILITSVYRLPIVLKKDIK